MSERACCTRSENVEINCCSGRFVPNLLNPPHYEHSEFSHQVIIMDLGKDLIQFLRLVSCILRCHLEHQFLKLAHCLAVCRIGAEARITIECTAGGTSFPSGFQFLLR